MVQHVAAYLDSSIVLRAAVCFTHMYMVIDWSGTSTFNTVLTVQVSTVAHIVWLHAVKAFWHHGSSIVCVLLALLNSERGLLSLYFTTH
jgi:hypothetical protein